MNNQPENSVIAEATSSLNLSPWTEQKFPFAGVTGQVTDESRQESSELRYEADDLRHEQPEFDNPVILPWENEPREPEPHFYNSAPSSASDETILEEQGIENPVELSSIDETGFENKQVQEEPDIENSFNVPQNLHYQVCRGRRSCLYRQTLDEKTIAYEVFLIRFQPDTFLGGKVFPAHERFPKVEDCGKTAWTYWTPEEAMKKFNEIEEKIFKS